MLARLVGAIGLATALTGAIVGTAGATVGQGASAAEAVVLNDRYEGQLGTSPQGTFAFYRFRLNPGQTNATINLQVSPDTAAVPNAGGFVVYAPRGGDPVVRGGARGTLVPNVSADLNTNDTGDFIVQVYNYDRNQPITFAIWATGLPAQAAPVATTPIAATPAAPASPVPAATSVAPAPAATPAPTAPAAPAAPAATSVPVRSTSGVAATATPTPGASVFSGKLAGGTSGRFELYEFNYPGGELVYTVKLQVSPDNAEILKNAGFNVYQPGQSTVLVKGGAQASLRPNVSANVISSVPGVYAVQVYNYNAEGIEYELSLEVGQKENTRP
jgi:hypothetical protein